MDDNWMIWSNEHRSWWMHEGWGYTTRIDRAGRFSERAAKEIVDRANIIPRNPPNEVMVLAPDPAMIKLDQESGL